MPTAFSSGAADACLKRLSGVRQLTVPQPTLPGHVPRNTRRRVKLCVSQKQHYNISERVVRSIGQTRRAGVRRVRRCDVAHKLSFVKKASRFSSDQMQNARASNPRRICIIITRAFACSGRSYARASPRFGMRAAFTTSLNSESQPGAGAPRARFEHRPVAAACATAAEALYRQHALQL